VGWGKIRDKIYSVGRKVEPHAYAFSRANRKSGTAANTFKNIDNETTTATANYAPIAGTVIALIPGFQLVGAGVIAAGTAAQYKKQNEEYRKALRANARSEAEYQAQLAAFNAEEQRQLDIWNAQQEQSVFSPTTTNNATMPVSTGSGQAIADGSPAFAEASAGMGGLDFKNPVVIIGLVLLVGAVVIFKPK